MKVRDSSTHRQIRCGSGFSHINAPKPLPQTRSLPRLFVSREGQLTSGPVKLHARQWAVRCRHGGWRLRTSNVGDGNKLQELRGVGWFGFRRAQDSCRALFLGSSGRVRVCAKKTPGDLLSFPCPHCVSKAFQLNCPSVQL